MARMDVTVTGPGANPGKIMFYLGMLFVVVGALIGGGGLLAALGTHELEAALFGLVFVVMFCGIGGFFAKIGHNQMHASDDVLAEGAFYLGKIYDYEPDYQILMNGQPCITLVVRYLMNGEIHEAHVNTVDVNAARYPRGATVGIKLLGFDPLATILPLAFPTVVIRVLQIIDIKRNSSAKGSEKP